MPDGGRVVWHGDAFQAGLKAEFVRRVRQCCILLTNRCKVLLSVAGTGTRQETAAEEGHRLGKAARRDRLKATRAEVKEFNAAHKLGIGLGKIKRQRVNKGGTISNRRAPRKKKD